MAYIVALRDRLKNKIYPRTTSDAVYVDTQTTLADHLLDVEDEIADKLDKTAEVHERVMVSDSDGNITTDSQISLDELHRLNGITGNIQTQLNGKQPTIYIWKLKKTYSNGLAINNDGKIPFANIYSENIDSQGRTVAPIPRGSSIYGCEIVEYAGYYYGLNCILHPNGGNEGNIYLCGIPSSKIETVFGDSTHNKVTTIQIWVPYTLN